MIKQTALILVMSCIAAAAFPQKLPVKTINPGNCYKIFFDDMVISSSSEFSKVNKAKAKGGCAGFRTPNVNYKTQTLIFNMVVADCRAAFSTEVRKDDTAKVYRCITTITPSYCREVKLQSEWLIIPKLPAGYKVVFEENTTRLY